MLITYDECADLLGVSPTDTLLQRLVKSTDSWAKQRLGRQFERTTYTLYPRGFGVSRIFLRESPIRQLIEIRIDPTGQFGDNTIVDIGQFAFNPDPFDDDPAVTFIGIGWWGEFRDSAAAGLRRFWWPFPELTNAIQVKVEAGWWAADDTGHDSDLPGELREKLIERVAAKYKQGPNEEMQNERQGDYSWQKFAETDERILKALRRYKR
jgi:hypothetical protein